jgi:hypothetical protein
VRDPRIFEFLPKIAAGFHEECPGTHCRVADLRCLSEGTKNKLSMFIRQRCPDR